MGAQMSFRSVMFQMMENIKGMGFTSGNLGRKNPFLWGGVRFLFPMRAKVPLIKMKAKPDACDMYFSPRLKNVSINLTSTFIWLNLIFRLNVPLFSVFLHLKTRQFQF